jgi:hypothetical protein
MRTLATFALAILTGTAVAATVENIIVKNGDHSYVNGNGTDPSTRELGRHYASFELDGVRYVITDAAMLERIAKVLEPQVELGKRQAALGERQAALGVEQARLGAEQARLGAKQAATRNDERQRELAEQQRGLAEEQRKLGDRQRELGDRQRELGEQQRAAGKIAEKELEKIFRNAVSSGVARRR